MYLISGATGFIGRRLLYRLSTHSGAQVRVLLRPGSDVARLSRPISFHTMIGDIRDPDSLLAAMDGVHTVIHLMGTDGRGRHSSLPVVDIGGTQAVVEAARAARVGRIIYLSRAGADRASAYSTLSAKGQIEEIIKSSGLAHTIFRLSVVFGEGDHFSENIAMLASAMPLYPVPGDGESLFQPLWVEDLVTCLLMSLEDQNLIDVVLPLGGPEMLTYRRVVMRVMRAAKCQHPIVGIPFLTNRALIWFLDGLFARWPVNSHWIEAFSSGQSAELGAIERHFGFRPSAFDLPLLSSYLTGRHHRLRFWRYIFTKSW